MKANREYRNFTNLELSQDENNENYIVRGTAVVFNVPTCLYECNGIKYFEIIDSKSFNECDISDVIFNYNHGGKVVARIRNKTLKLDIDYTGVHIEADLGGTEEGRKLYEEIKGGYIDRMSFSFVMNDDDFDYDNETRTKKIKRIKKLYDVSAVDIPAYNETSISARSFFVEEYTKELDALEQAKRRLLLLTKTY